jgi:short-subunit dehydrogenase
MTNSTNGRATALITGASSGIGAAFAERLAHDQHNVILVARRRDRLETLAKRLRDAYGVAAEVIVADLTVSDQLQSVEKRIAEEPQLDMLVNNAGFGGYRAFTSLDAETAENLIRLQVTAVTRLTRAALPGMVSHGRGQIVNVSSRLAFSSSLAAPTIPKRAVYAATKAYVTVFTEILSTELAGTGVKVQALCPGVVSTEFHESMGLDPSRFPQSMVMKPEDVVQASLAGLRLGEVVCIPPLDDPGLLETVRHSERVLLEQSGTGTLASRYAE